MRILADQNISHRLISKLSDLDFIITQVRLLGLENASDKEIWEYAKQNDFVILTFDADFYEFSLIWGHPPKIIWIRTGNQTTLQIAALLREHFHTLSDFHKDKELACLEIITPARED